MLYLRAFYALFFSLTVEILSFLSISLTFGHRHEFQLNHGEWINSVKPALDPAISTEIQEKIELTDTEIENCKAIRNDMRLALNSLLKVMVLVI